MKISDYTTEYLRYCRVEKENCSDTVDDYRRVLKKTIDCIGDVDVGDIDSCRILELKEVLLNENLSDAYRAKVISVLKNFLMYLSDFVKLDVYDYEKIKIPRVKDKPVDYMSEEEIDDFISILPEKRLSELRYKALVSTLADTGARIGEVLGIMRDEIDYEEREVVVRGKGGRYRKIYFSERSIHYIEKYNAVRKDKSKYLFGNVNDDKKATGKWDPKDVNRKFRYWSKIFGRRVHSHIFRKSFCTNQIHNGMPLAYVSKLAGHADNGRTTARYYYSPMSDEDAKAVYRKFERKASTITSKSKIISEEGRCQI